MKIGFISIIKEAWGGSEELWAAGALALIKEGHEVIVSTMWTGFAADKMKQIQEAGAKIIIRRGYVAPGISVKKRIAKKINIYLRNKVSNPYRQFFNEKPEVVVYTGACDSLKDDPFFLEEIFAAKLPLIIINQVHTEYVKTFDAMEAHTLTKAFDFSKKNLFVSQRNKEVMERFLAKKIPNAAIIRNPVNLSEVSPLPLSQNETVQFAMVANLLINHKGQDILLDVLRSEKWQLRKWHLHIYGSGVDEEYIKELCTFYRLNNMVTFHGRVTDIRSVWSGNDILLMPSRLEGIPLALVEAMLCARPAVVTDVAGFMEWIDEGIEGFIAEGANTYSFDKALERAWNARTQWEVIGLNAYKRAKKQYDPNPGETLLQVIKSVSGQ